MALANNDTDDSVPLDPMEEYPEEGETEDSSENKDDDSKKLPQHRLPTKSGIAVTNAAWNVHYAQRVSKPYVSQIQQPPEISFFA